MHSTGGIPDGGMMFSDFSVVVTGTPLSTTNSSDRLCPRPMCTAPSTCPASRVGLSTLPTSWAAMTFDRVDQALLEPAMTLGAKKSQLLWLMFRASFPGIFGSFRILYDIGWTYVILAEMVNARKGVGYMVEAARKVLDIDRVYAGIIAIGLAAFLFRWILTLLERQLFPWRPTLSQSTAPAVAKVAAKAHTHA